MKRLFIVLSALPLACAGGASAQTMANTGGAVGVQNRIANLEARFNAGVDTGAFTTAERNRIQRQLMDLRGLERSYSSNGLSGAERRTLQQRIRAVRDQLRMAGGSNWANQYGWSDTQLDAYAGSSYDAYGRVVPNASVTYDQYGRVIANSGVVYDQNGRPIANGGMSDQYGRPIANTNVYGQGDAYRRAPSSGGIGNILGGVLGAAVGGGSGVGGILGSILGRGGLRTGEVLTGGLGSVLGSAAGLGSQYRDNNKVYYRSDGQRVYEIDARTNTVLRVYPVQR